MFYNLHTPWEVLFSDRSHCSLSSFPRQADPSVLEDSVWGQSEEVPPRDRISALSELLCSEFSLPTSMVGVDLMGQLVSSSIPCLSRKAVPPQLPAHDANCEDHYSRQQEEWISQLNILLDYPANPFLWLRTALGLKSFKTKQHRSCNILKQGNGQPQGWWVKHCTGKEVMEASLGVYTKAKGPVSWLHVENNAKLTPAPANQLGLFDVNAFSSSQRALFILHCLLPSLLCQNCSTELSCLICWKIQANCLSVAN